MFEKRSFRDLYEAMATDARQRTSVLTDFEEGSVVRSLFESFSYELALLYEQMDLVYQAGFVDTAAGANLDRVVAVLGITRNEPDFAAGEIAFERDPGSEDDIYIPVGTLVTTEEDPEAKPPKKAYVTTEEGWLRGGQTFVEVKVQAEERGPGMTAESETVVVMPRPVPGVKAVYNKKPIRFRGRERETDEELRDRSKKALLASGRASNIAIENALLGMPGVRGVRLRENFPPQNPLATGGNGHADGSGPGVVEVFVDGMNGDNAASLRERVDQVRAAGIYVILGPAQAIALQAVLRIETDGRAQGEERAALERRVRDVVFQFVDRLRMGQPLLFTQLTREVLNVKGVTDLSDFRVTTFREMPARGDAHPDAWRATGEVVLRRPADRLEENLTVPVRQVLRTRRGLQLEVTKEVLFGKGVAEMSASVRSLRDGREGELLRTGSAVAWEPLSVDRTPLEISNRAPVLLRREVFGPDAKRIDAALEERFVPDLVRVASEQKPLSVHVLIRVSFPNAGMREAITASVQARVDALAPAVGIKGDPGLPLDDAARAAARDAIQGFLAGVREASASLASRLAVVPDDASHQALLATVREYFAERQSAGGGDPAAGAIVAIDLEDRLRARLGESLGPDAEEKLRVPLRQQLAATLAAFAAERLDRFPAASLASELREGTRRASEAELKDLDAQGRALADEMGAQRVEIAGGAIQVSKGEITAEAYQAMQEALVALESRQRELDAKRQAAVRKQGEDAARVDGLVEAIRKTAEELLRQLSAPEGVDAILAGKSISGAAELAVRLRTVTFEGEIHADVPRIEPSFVETPEADPVFVFSRLLPLTGTLSITLPITAVEEEKRVVRAEVRQAVSDYLDGLKPEEKVDLDRVRALADAHERVLRAAFEPADALKAEKGRVGKGKLNVNPFEKVVLGDESGFEIVA